MMNSEEKELCKRLTLMKYLHFFATKYFRHVFIALSITCIVIQTVSGAFMFYGFSETTHALDVILAVMDLSGACVSAVVLFLKPGSRAEQHQSRVDSLQRLINQMQLNKIKPSEVHLELSKILEDGLSSTSMPSLAINQFTRYSKTHDFDSNSFLFGELNV